MTSLFPAPCAGCPSMPTGVRYVPPTGSASSRIMLVGDSPWFDEVRLGYPFAGAAGAMLDRLLSRLGTERGAHWLTNVHKCKPRSLGYNDNPERFPEAAMAIEHCRPYLDDEIERLQPRVFLCMGNVALRRIAGLTGVEEHHSYVLPTPYGVPAITTWHPSALMQGNHKLSPCFLFALRRAQEISSGSFTPTAYSLLLDPAPDDLRGYLARFPQDLPEINVDIETPESPHLDEDDIDKAGPSYEITRFSFSLEDGVGISCPFMPPYVDILDDLLSRSALMLEYTESHFDSKRLRAAGLRVPRRIASPMWAWHLVQSDLPKGLGFVAPFYYAGPPWKHLSDAQPAFYSAMDAAVMQSVWLGTRRDLERQGRWHAFETHCTAVDEIFIEASRAGLKIDRTAQSSFKQQLIREYSGKLNALQAAVPDEVRLLYPRDGYRKPVKEGAQPPAAVVKSEGTEDGEIAPEVRAVLLQHARLAERDFESPYPEPHIERRQVWLCPFNPNSTNQVRALIAHFKLPVPRNSREDRETTEAKHLKKLARRAPVFRLILDCRERQKLISSYMWPLDAEGYVHPTLGHHPSTWRKSCRGPNLQTIPKRKELAAQFRKMIVSETANEEV